MQNGDTATHPSISQNRVLENSSSVTTLGAATSSKASTKFFFSVRKHQKRKGQNVLKLWGLLENVYHFHALRLLFNYGARTWASI
jgi:hypothetical protein